MGTRSGGRCPLVLGVIAGCAAATVFFGIYPSPLVDFAINAGQSISALLAG